MVSCFKTSGYLDRTIQCFNIIAILQYDKKKNLYAFHLKCFLIFEEEFIFAVETIT